MKKLLYIHGFGSCGTGNKSTALRNYFGDEVLIAPDLPYNPDEAVALLEDTIRSSGVSLLVGSSLGGFYATFLAERFGLQAVLINPSVHPYETLASYVGINRRFCDDAPFEWKSEYLDTLRRLVVAPRKGDYLVLLQSGDEVLDYRIARRYYEKHRVVVEYGGNHRFENIEDYLCMIARFWRK
jgi:predicted esterase YcpF (UPF0227 family)